MTESQSKHYDLTKIAPEIHDMTKTSTPRPWCSCNLTLYNIA
jgi:hypothetical protein